MLTMGSGREIKKRKNLGTGIGAFIYNKTIYYYNMKKNSCANFYSMIFILSRKKNAYMTDPGQ